MNLRDENREKRHLVWGVLVGGSVGTAVLLEWFFFGLGDNKYGSMQKILGPIALVLAAKDLLNLIKGNYSK